MLAYVFLKRFLPHPDRSESLEHVAGATWLTACPRTEMLTPKLWTVQATPQGAGLYRKLGFEDVGNMDIDMSSFGGQGVYRYVCMIRPTKDS